MKNSQDRIITSHVGSLPRPDALIEANRARIEGHADEAAFQKLLRQVVADVVAAQKAAGIDIPNDGEFGKSMGQKFDYGAWSSYSHFRLSGINRGGMEATETITKNPKPGDLVLAGNAMRRDRALFAEAYGDPDSGVFIAGNQRAAKRPFLEGPIEYIGHDAVQADIDNFKAALEANGYDEGFITAVAPGSAARLVNLYYDNDADYLFAAADAMAEEYKAIVDAGLILQLDDPSIAESWDQIVPEPSVADYKKYSMLRVEALNRAIKGLPKDRIRFHLCWGSWHGPHTTDIAMKDIVEVMLAIDVQAYTFEAANARHEHEWTVWKDVKLPDGKIVIPGIVGHATNVVEHPELVAERICRFADVVGRENVIASTDCGLGGRIHPQIAWAKLEALSAGAKIASERLWG